MANEPYMKKIETHIENAVWERYESWAKDQGPAPNNKRDMMRALFRLFLAAPETLKQLAFSGRPKQMERACLYYVDQIVEELIEQDEGRIAASGDAKAAGPKQSAVSRKSRGRKVG